jgi:hypothetical protein
LLIRCPCECRTDTNVPTVADSSGIADAGRFTDAGRITDPAPVDGRRGIPRLEARR